MTHVATLIANPLQPMRDDFAAALGDALPGQGDAAWLDRGVAIDIVFCPEFAAPEALRAIQDRIRARLAAARDTDPARPPVDVVVQKIAARRKRLLVADMDSTMIGQECIDELADFVGQKARVAAITESAMRGEIAFPEALRERVKLLAGLHAGIVDEVIAKRITLSPGAVALVRTMRRHGAHTCLVSGGFTVFTGRIAAAIGFDEHRGNTLVVGPDGRFTGEVAEPILGREAKLETLRELRIRFDLGVEETLAAGDGANDLLMIEDAGLGAAIRAKPVLAEAAAARIDHCDLTALLYAQGYRKSDFVLA